MKPTHFAATFILSLALLASAARAWGMKEHILLTQLAIERLCADPATPEGLKNFLITNSPDLRDRAKQKEFFLTARLGARPEGLTGLSYWCVAPDFRADTEKKKRVMPFNVPERPLHFVDLEILNTDPLKQVYKHDLSSLPDLSKAPKEMTDPAYRQAGYLPFAVRHSYDKLVEAFKAGRLSGDAAKPDDDDHALRWAGFLAHYTQDNTQPHHATVDYKTASYFADKKKAPNVHGEIEWRMNDDADEQFPELRKQFWDALSAELETIKDPVKEPDLWLATLDVSSKSYTALPLIGLAAMLATGQGGTPEAPVGPAGPIDTVKFFNFAGDWNGQKTTVLRMKAHQQAWAVLRTQEVLRRAWDESHPDQSK